VATSALPRTNWSACPVCSALFSTVEVICSIAEEVCCRLAAAWSVRAAPRS
jgi:hypothetical protein